MEFIFLRIISFTNFLQQLDQLGNGVFLYNFIGNEIVCADNFYDS